MTPDDEALTWSALALTDERGILVWISAAMPGRSSEISARLLSR